LNVAFHFHPDRLSAGYAKMGDPCEASARSQASDVGPVVPFAGVQLPIRCPKLQFRRCRCTRESRADVERCALQPIVDALAIATTQPFKVGAVAQFWSLTRFAMARRHSAIPKRECSIPAHGPPDIGLTPPTSWRHRVIC
jgi:hypothetical protein